MLNYKNWQDLALGSSIISRSLRCVAEKPIIDRETYHRSLECSKIVLTLSGVD